MAASPFAFYRGAAAVMAADLATTPVSGLRVQACGDAQPRQLRRLRRARRPAGLRPERLRRDAAGAVGVGRQAAHRRQLALAGRALGCKRSERSAALLAAARSYREAMRGFAGRGRPRGLVRAARRRGVAGADSRTADPGSVKRSERGTPSTPGAGARGASAGRGGGLGRGGVFVEGGGRGLTAGRRSSPTARPCRATASTCWTAIEFRRIARKVVGVGSVGTRAWVVLLTGRDDEDPLFLQAKEAEASVLEPYAGPSRFRNHGRRVVEGQRLMQAAGTSLPRLVRGGRPRRARPRLLRAPALGLEALGRGRAPDPGRGSRSTPRSAAGPWPGRTRGAATGSGSRSYLGGGDSLRPRDLREFAELYADQTERDHAALCDAIASGRLESSPDP